MHSSPVPDPFQLALEAERVDNEDTVANYLTTHAGQGPNIDLFLKIYNPQTQSLHERLGLSRLIGLFQHRSYWNRRARMLLGDHVPHSEGVPNQLDTAMFELVYDNYVTVMTQTVEGFAAVEPASAESSVARSDLAAWIESTRLNVTATIRELIDIVLSEQRLDPNNAGHTTTTPLDPIGDIFASCLAESKPVLPPDRTPMLELAAIACAQELAVRLSLEPQPRARPPTPQPKSPLARAQHRGRSRRVIEDDDERLLPRSRPVQGQSREWVIVDETIDEHAQIRPNYPRGSTPVPRLGYGSEDPNYPFLLP